jgi:hypothetical protein
MSTRAQHKYEQRHKRLSQDDVDNLRGADLHALADIAQRYVNHFGRRKWWKLWLGR